MGAGPSTEYLEGVERLGALVGSQPTVHVTTSLHRLEVLRLPLRKANEATGSFPQGSQAPCKAQSFFLSRACESWNADWS